MLSWLLEYAPSRLTGTGACVFAEFDTESEARQVLEQAPEWLNGFVAKVIVRVTSGGDISAYDVVSSLFPDKQKDFVFNISETDTVLVK